MKIAHINSIYGINSTGRMTKELVDELEQLGHQNFIAYMEGISEASNSYRIVSDFQRNIHALLSRISGKQAYWSYFETKKLIKKLKEFQPDIVHLGVIHSNGINLRLILEYLSQNNILTVITLHDYWFITGKCTHPIRVKCEKWKTGCYDCEQLKCDNKSWFFDKTKLMYENKNVWLNQIENLYVIGVSEWMASEARESIVKNKNVVKIYNWVDRYKFYPRKSNSIVDNYNIKGKFIILGASVTWKYGHKGFDDFLELSKKIDDDTVILLVGNLEADIALPNNFIVTGKIDNVDKLAEYYSVSDVYLNLSPHETFGLTTAEALCCGTPVIVYDNTASPELVGPNCGYVVDNGNMNELLHKINTIKSKGKQTYTKSCLDFSAKNFSKEFNIKKYIELYNKAMLNNIASNEDLDTKGY